MTSDADDYQRGYDDGVNYRNAELDQSDAYAEGWRIGLYDYLCSVGDQS